ncbi:MAG: phage tail spike protein, partial [Olsenella sp.]
RLAAMSAEHEVVLSQADPDGTIIRELFRGRITDAGEDGRLSRTITCEGCLAYLADSIVRPYGTYADTTSTTPQWTDLAPATARTYAEWLISQHNSQTDATKRFAIGRDELPDTPITRSSTEYPTTLAELKDKVLTDLSCYARAYVQDGTRYIDLLADGGGDAAQTISFGTNLLDYATTRSMADVKTCIIPVASSTSSDTVTPTLDGIQDGPVAGHDGCSKQGDHVLYDAGVTKYGIRAEKVGYDATTEQGLLDAACADLTTASDVVESLSISAVDLSHVDPTVGPIGLLDWVRVTSPPHGVDQSILCLKVSIDVDDPTQTKYTLGATLPTLTNSTAIRERETRQRITEEVQPVAAISQEAKATAQTAQESADTKTRTTYGTTWPTTARAGDIHIDTATAKVYRAKESY